MKQTAQALAAAKVKKAKLAAALKANMARRKAVAAPKLTANTPVKQGE